MQVHAVPSESEIKEKTEPSRLEMLVEHYSDLAKAIAHKVLEDAVRAEFEEFIGPRIGQKLDADGKARVDYRNGNRVDLPPKIKTA